MRAAINNTKSLADYENKGCGKLGEKEDVARGGAEGKGHGKLGKESV